MVYLPFQPYIAKMIISVAFICRIHLHVYDFLISSAIKLSEPISIDLIVLKYENEVRNTLFTQNNSKRN